MPFVVIVTNQFIVDNARYFLLVRAVQLRAHPWMNRKSDFPNWPPVWTTTKPDKSDRPTGEVGILEQVVMNNNLIENKVLMFMKVAGVRYMGILAFDDIAVCSQLYNLFKSKIGHSIKEIGDLDVSQLL